MALLFSIRVVFFEIRAGANHAVLDFLNACSGGLCSDFGSKVDFVVRRTDAWGNLHYEIFWGGSGSSADGGDGFRNDAKFRPLAPRVGESDSPTMTVGDIDGGTVCHIDAEAEVAFGGEEGVAVRNGKCVCAGNARNICAVDLTGLCKRHV